MAEKSCGVRVVEDDRGIVVFPLESREVLRAMKNGNLRHFHVATVKPGAVRGNHRHPCHVEYLLFIGRGGGIVLGQKGKITSMKVENAMVRVPKNVAHAVVNRGRGEISVICFYGGPAKRKLERIREEIA
jgi:oxalate decarboxylase/phosphoglucose isomerase-like protein (cupin superfamily)